MRNKANENAVGHPIGWPFALLGVRVSFASALRSG